MSKEKIVAVAFATAMTVMSLFAWEKKSECR